MEKKNKESIKIGTKKEALFTEAKEATEKRIENYEKSLMFEKEILKMCEKVIKEEHAL